MNEQRANSDPWDTCPPGELQKLATRLRWRRRDREVAKAVRRGGAMVVLLVAAGLAVQSFRGQPDSKSPMYGGVMCAEVQANLERYVAGPLNPQLAERIRIHLEHCPECGPPFRRMMAEMPQAVSLWPASGSGPACACAHCQRSSLAAEPRFLTERSRAVSVAMHVPR